MKKNEYLYMLKDCDSFTRDELMDAIKKSEMTIKESAFKARLQRHLQSEEIVRIGRNKYCVPKKGIKHYSYDYSVKANDVAQTIIEKYPHIDFAIMESIQFNEFINHQIAHNTIYVSVESDLGEYVFEILKEKYDGKVLIEPSVDMYRRYWADDIIIIRRLITETPKSRQNKWNSRLEKILVDVVADEIITESMSDSEIQYFYEDAIHKYVIDVNCLSRYARRRGALERLTKYMKAIKEGINEE